MSDRNLPHKLANLIRMATVAKVRENPPAVKLAVAGLVTDWRPYFVARAGNTAVASLPSIGEQGLLFSPFGDLEQSVFLPGIYSTNQPAPVTEASRAHVRFPDGSTVDYDSDTNKLSIDVVGTGLVVVNCKIAEINTNTATLTADESVTIDSPITTFTGAVTVQKTLTWMGGMIGYGIPTGRSASCSITGDLHFVDGTITHNGVTIDSTHVHVDSVGGTTGVPQ